MRPPDCKNPYVGPYAFDEKDADLFFGRDDEARTLLSLVVSERIVVFCSPSGAGKTSLLNTRLVPGLRQRGFHVLPIARVGGEPLPAISPANVYVFNTVCILAGGGADFAALATQTLDGFLRRSENETAGENLARVLILDQFEEILTTHPGRWQDRRGFFHQLRQALLDDPALSVVLVLREDHLAGLDPFASLLPGQLRTRFRLERLRRACALDAIHRPAEVAGRPFDDGVAEQLVDNLSQEHHAGKEGMSPGELVEPVQLQVVCYQLWENLRGRPGKTITEQDCRELGNVDQALERFYDSAVEWAAKESRVQAARIRRWCGTALITPNRIRSQVSEGVDTSSDLPREAAELLLKRHLIRREETRGGIWYELAHDRFIDPVLRSNEKAQSPEATRLATDAKAWDEAKREPSFLYRGQQLATASRTAEDGVRELSRLERDFLFASQKAEETRKAQRTRRFQFATAASAIGIVISIALSVYAMDQRQMAIDQRQIARNEARLAKSRQFAVEATRKTEADPDGGLELALKALSWAETPEAEEALHRTLSTPVARRGLSLPIVSDSASAFAFSPDGLRFAAVTEKNRVSLRDSKTGQQILTLPPARSAITSLEISPGGDQIAVGDSDGLISLWRADTGALLRNLNVGFPINSIAFSPVSTLLAVASESPTATLWNTVTGKKLRSLTDGNFEVVRDVAFNAEGTQLATAGDDGLAIVWDVTSGRRLGEPLRHPHQVTAVAFSPDGQLATACDDHLLRIWDVQTTQGVLKILSGHQDGILDVAYSPNGHYLASASLDKSTKLWNTRSGEEVHTFPATDGAQRVLSAQRVLFKPRPIGNRISLAMTASAEVSGPGSLTFWDVLPEEITTHTSPSPIVDLGFRPDGTSLVATTQDGQTILWNTVVKTSPVLLTASLPSDFKITMAPLSLDGSRLALIGSKRKVENDSMSLLSLREIPSGREILRLNLGKGYLPAISLSPDGRFLATAGDSRLWNLQTGREIPLPQRYSLAVAFSPDGKLVATAGTDEAQICTITGKLIRRFANPYSPILLASFSPDGRRLATASLDHAIRLWDIETGQVLRTLQGHTDSVTALVFSPDGQRLASGDRDTSVKIWDVESGQEAFALHGHTGVISALAFSPGDGKWLTTAGAEGTVRLEPMKLEDLVEIAQNRLSRRAGFPPQERRLSLREERQ